MAKRFKLRFPINIHSFKLCRLKSPSSWPKNPKPAKYRLSPVNPKAFDTTRPSLSPAPPPSTPELSFVSSSSKPAGIMIRSSNGCDSSPEFRRRAVEKPRKASQVYALIDGDEDDENDDDSLALLDSSRSFSCEQYPRGYRSAEKHEKNKTPSSEEERAAAKVRESVAVVKRSEDPYEDFKRSMVEMIMEKQMFHVADLEELLRCFLSLNSRQYHGIIVEAFSEIWEILFCDSHNHRLCF